MAITFERNIDKRAVILQVEKGDFGALFPLPYAPIARSKPLQKRADIWFIPELKFLEQTKCRHVFGRAWIELSGPMGAEKKRIKVSSFHL